SLFVDPFLPRKERERILDEAIRSGRLPAVSSKTLDDVRASVERAVAERGIAVRPEARGWLEARTKELGARLDQLAGQDFEAFLRVHREDILNLSVLNPARSRVAWEKICGDARVLSKDVASACRITKADLGVLIPQGIEVLKSLGDENVAALVDLLNL